MNFKRLLNIVLLQSLLIILVSTLGYGETDTSFGKQVKDRFDQRVSDAMLASAKVDICANIPTALYLYKLDNGEYPATEEGLAALMEKPARAFNWKGPYLLNQPLDPWGRGYCYAYPGNHSGPYDLFSFGPDGNESADDIANWMFEKYEPPKKVKE